MCWREWLSKIPAIQFPSDWKVTIILNLGGAISRFWIDKNDHNVSVYLDCYNVMGFFGLPYCEIHPYEDDVYRCPMEDTDDFIKNIEIALAHESSSKEYRIKKKEEWERMMGRTVVKKEENK